MRSRNTIIWLSVLIALSAFAYYYEIVGSEKRRRAEEAQQRLFALEKEKIDTIELAGPEERVRCLKNKEGEWRLAEPVEAGADPEAVDDLLTNMAQTKVQRTVADKAADPGAYGLADGAFQITLKGGGKSYGLWIGDFNPTGEYAYARREGDKRVVLIFANNRNHLVKTAFELRDKKIMSAPPHRVERILFSRTGAEEVSLVQEMSDNSWRLERPIAAPADKKEVASVLEVLDGINLKRFICEKAETLAPYGLDSPRLALTLIMTDKSQQRLLLGNTDEEKGEVFAMVEGKETVFTLPAQAGEFLAKDASALRDKRVVSFNPGLVLKISLLSGERPPLTLKRAGRGDDVVWLLEGEEKETEAQSAAVAEFLYELLQLRAGGFAEGARPGADYGFAASPLRVALWTKSEDGEADLALTFGRKQDKTGLLYIKSALGVFMVEEAALEKLDQGPAYFLEERKAAPDPQPGSAMPSGHP